MLRRLLLVLSLVAVLLVGGADVALAQEISNDASAVAPIGSLTLNAFTVTLLVSVLIPIATGIASRVIHSTTGLQIFTAAVATATGLITTATQLDGTAVLSLASLQLAAIDFVVATAMYLGIYKPHNVNAKLAGASG